jgi:hypothetical protein
MTVTPFTACDRSPGIGKVLALTILYEIHDITRFDRVQEFASYARLVKCAHQSAGNTYGTGGAKMGNVHLKWAFSEAAVLFLRHAPSGKKLLGEIEKKHGKGKALSILAHKIGDRCFTCCRAGPCSQWTASARRSRAGTRRARWLTRATSRPSSQRSHCMPNVLRFSRGGS